ncbi:MAG TPA: protein kinase [Gemmatimonadales bacterium]|jgi:serine/threonine-protein kinase
MSPSKSPRKPELQTRIEAALADRYRIARQLGQGGMATVYLADDLKHGRHVAIKVLRPDLGAVLGAERFLAEIRITARLDHPHILTLIDSGEAGGLLYYVLPYIRGESLRDKLAREQQLGIDETLAITRQIAGALDHAHRQGVIHRDIKPENILLHEGEAMLADFGIALAVREAGGARLTETGLSLGTPQYMSPEQATGDRQLTARSDIYSLAAVCYEMLAGEPPVTGPNAQAMVAKLMTERPVSLRVVRDTVPEAMALAIQKALSKVPADRFASAGELVQALETAGTGGARTAPSTGRRILLGGAVLAVIVSGLTLLRPWRIGPAPLPVIGRTMQMTRNAGLEVDPALSPNGETVAFAAGPPTAMRIYVRRVSGGRAVALTGDTTGNFRWPRWSPDGSQLAYQGNDGIYVVPALGGTPRRLTHIDLGTPGYGIEAGTPLTGFDWSPDGTRIVSSRGFGGTGLTVTTIATGDTVNLPAPFAASGPVWSPDGGSIAVVAGNPIFTFGTGYFANAGTSGIWIVHLDGASPTRIAPDSAVNISPQWAPDGRAIFWVSDRDGSRDIYRQRLGRGGAAEEAPRRLTTGTDAQGLSLTRTGDRMAYARLHTYSSIWSIPVPLRGTASIRAASRITTGNETIEAVDVSPDGKWLVFDSDRNGNADLYIVPVTGGEARQLTTDPANDYSADWSPDGRRIAFHSLQHGNRDIYTVGFDGTGLTRRTSSPDEELDPDWAPDGEALTYEVIGRQVERHGFDVLPLGDGARPRFFSIAGGDFARWAPDGKAFIYHAPDGLRLHRIDSGGDSLRVSNEAIGAEAFYAAWSRDGATLYYLARSPRGWAIRAMPAAGGASRVLVDFDDPTRQHTKYGFTTDGRVFYFTIGAPESDIWVADLAEP